MPPRRYLLWCANGEEPKERPQHETAHCLYSPLNAKLEWVGLRVNALLNQTVPVPEVGCSHTHTTTTAPRTQHSNRGEADVRMAASSNMIQHQSVRNRKRTTSAGAFHAHAGTQLWRLTPGTEPTLWRRGEH